MKTTEVPLLKELERIQAQDFGGIRGKFHSHITLALTSAEGREALAQYCREERVKLTLIELADFDTRQQTDVMTTEHYRENGEDAVATIVGRLIERVGSLTEAGFEVLRVKLEHESRPTLERCREQQYGETHIKLAIPNEAFAEAMEWLREGAAQHHYVPSSNPRSRSEEETIQFVNRRFYDHSLEAWDEAVAQWRQWLEAEGPAHQIRIVEVKSEMTLFDTNLSLDAWWK